MNILRFILSLPKTIYFNFYYLPFSQAIKLPIWLYKVRTVTMRGRIIINSEHINPGMIKLGLVANPLYDIRNKFVWENRGSVIFNGTCMIGHGSGISTGKNGKLQFGNNFIATESIKIISYINIQIGNNVRIAWESILMDTDFHETINCTTEKRSIALKPIKIGNNNWIGIRNLILKGTETPDFTIIGANSILNKKYDIPEYTIFAGTPPKVVKTGVYRDLRSYVE